MVRLNSYTSCDNVISDIPSISNDQLEIPSISLSNNVNMPLLGLGTTHSGGYYHDVVLFALRECGYRMIDTARRYGVEAELGLAWKSSGIPRDDLFLSSKLWPTDFARNTRDAFKKSCEKLRTDYLDLYMTHFPEVPNGMGDPKEVRDETWRKLELLYDEGRIRALGVSNYSESDLDELLEHCSIAPHVNQCEFHPWYNPQSLREYCSDNGILFTGYCPMAKGRRLDEESVVDVARQVDRTPAQVCLRWSIQHGVPVIPKSSRCERIAENASIFDFELSISQMTKMDTWASKRPLKIVSANDLQHKFDLPDGYKLNGRVYGVPKTDNPSSTCSVPLVSSKSFRGLVV